MGMVVPVDGPIEGRRRESLLLFRYRSRLPPPPRYQAEKQVPAPLGPGTLATITPELPSVTARETSTARRN
jgi:hypothetical protein